MTDERQRGAQETDRTDDGPAALGEVVQLQEQLAARGSRVRQDAERALDRAAALRADGDPRAGIAISACRETLGAYHEAVDRSVRQARGAADSAVANGASSPARPSTPWAVGGLGVAGPSVDSAPSTARSTRHKIARLLAAAMATGVLGLVGWGGLPSWSTVLATSPGHSAAPPEAPVAAEPPTEPRSEPPAEPPEVSTGAGAPRPEGRTGVVGRSGDRSVPADQPAPPDLPDDDVRGVLAMTLPGVGELSPSVATVADGLRAVGEAAASVATVGEPLSSDDPSDGNADEPNAEDPSDGNADGDAAEAARSLLPDPVDTVKATVDAASDAAEGVDELGDGELLDLRSSDEAGDGDGLEGVIDDGEQLWDDPDAPKGDDRADASSADGMSGGAGLDR